MAVRGLSVSRCFVGVGLVDLLCSHLNEYGGEVTWHVLSLSLVKMVAESHAAKIAASHMVVIYSEVSRQPGWRQAT